MSRAKKLIATKAPSVLNMAKRQMDRRAQQVAIAANHFQYGIGAGKPDDALARLAASLITYARAAASAGNLVLNAGRTVSTVIAQLENELRTARNARLQEEQLTEREKAMLAAMQMDK